MSSSLLHAVPPWVGLIPIGASEFTDLLWRLQRGCLAEGVVVRVRGSKMKTSSSLFDELSAALQFPHYFGENWDALDECLNDLSWLPGRAYLLGVQEASAVLSNEDSALEIFARLLERTCRGWATPIQNGESWDRPAVPFHVLLQCDEGQEAILRKRFVKAGLTVAMITAAELE